MKFHNKNTRKISFQQTYHILEESPQRCSFFHPENPFCLLISSNPFEMPGQFPCLHNTFWLLLAPRTFHQVISPFKQFFILLQLPNLWLLYCRTCCKDSTLFLLCISEKGRQPRTSSETGLVRFGVEDKGNTLEELLSLFTLWKQENG